MKTKLFIRTMVVLYTALLVGTLPSRAYFTDWDYSVTAKDNGEESDGGNYTFRYMSEDTKKNFMDFKTRYMFNVKNHRFKWNWDIRVNYGTVDNNNTTNVDVTIEYADGKKDMIAKADFVGYQSPTVTWSDRPVYFSRIGSSGDKYMFTLEYQPTGDDLRKGLKRIFICCKTTWKGGDKVRNFQYERDLDISSYTNMTPAYSCELDGDGNYLFKVSGTPMVDDLKIARSSNNINQYRGKYFHGKVSYGLSNYSNEWVDYDLTKNTKTGGTDENADFTLAVPVKSYTVPLRLSQLDYIIDVNRETQTYEGDDHYVYKLQTSTGDAYVEGILLKPYTRVKELSVEFDKWKKQNVVKWTRNEQVSDYVNYRTVQIDCQTEGTWYVLRYEKGQAPGTYDLVKEIGGNSTNLKAEDNEIDYDKEYVYRVVFLPKVLKEKYADRLVNLPGEGATHTKYDLWEEVSVKTTMDVPIKLSQDRSDDTGIHLIWEYNVQTQGCEWRIDKHRLGQTTWTPVTTIPVDTKQGTASYIEEGGSVCDQFVYRIMTTINDKELFSDTLVCNLPAGAYISEVRASTGTEEKNVIVKWRVERPGDDDIWFRILRRPIGNDEWTVLSDDIYGHAKEYTFIDDRVMAGSYYEYTVEAYGAKCDEQLVQTDSKMAPGFSQSRGTITGHIAFGTGTAVSGVRVNLVKSSADVSTDQPQFLSRYIDGEGKGLQWTANANKYADVLNGQRGLTLQLWTKPMGNLTANTSTTGGGMSYTLLYLRNALELGVKTENGEDYYLYAADASNGSVSVTDFPELSFSNYDFTHVAASYSNGTWTFYVGNDTLHAATMSVANATWNACEDKQATLSIGGSSRPSGASAFSGYVDDIRLWNRALNEKELNLNYTRILSGTENGLILYWPLDEGMNMKDYAFDVACQDGNFLLNHPEIGANATPDATVPDSKYLGLYGMTDAEGDYIIRGIPFQQGGTNYKLVPESGIHEFNPNSRSMFISPTSLTANNIDFEDVSSFPMSGYVYYAGTNIPVEGMEFYVDGELVTGNGKVKRTDSNGYYEISVPIGEHYVEAMLSGHKMVNGGRFPTEGTFNFDRRMQYDFADSTLVNFVGRVGGGERNDTLAVGFGASNNNIGIATITLQLNNESFSFNCQDDHISDATDQRTWESDTTSIASRTWTGTGYDSKYIFIRTDSLTGEFSALLPPLKFITKSVKIDKNRDIEFISLPEIDLTNVGRNLKDSMMVRAIDGDSTWSYYKYNTKLITTHFAKPEVKLWQKGGDGAFGERELEDYHVSSTETIDITDIWTRQDDGSVKYTYGFPVFDRSKRYYFNIRGYEAYVNYDSGTAVADTIPMNGQVLTIENEMSDSQDVVSKVTDSSVTDLQVGDIYNLKRNQLVLDDDGAFELKFKTGLPNITAPYTRKFSLFFERNGRTYQGPEFNAVVLGELSDGNNFVTDGPDVVSMVLRDPPGSKSKTTWKRGTIKTKIDNYVSTWQVDETFQLELIWGSNLTNGTGIGVMILSSSEATTTAITGEHGVFDWTTENDKTWVITTAENYSTSTGIKYVGSDGDLFIGTSHNLIVGTCRKLGFHRESDGIKLGVKEAISLSDSVKTDFAYAAYDIKNTMIPKIRETRNALLEYKDSISAASFKNTTEQDVYLTWLTPDNPNYGSEGTYVWKMGIKGKSQDMVLHYNNAIENWEETLRNNEEDKITAFNNKDDYYLSNQSFDGGSAYSYTERYDTTMITKTSNSKYAAAVINAKHRVGVNAATTFGANWELKTESGRKRSWETTDYDDNVTTFAEFDYDLNDGNPGTDFTVDIFDSPKDWSNIFLLRGGQSYNPYEPEETAQYYEPEKKHIISYGTQQMEQPIIAISTDGVVGAKSAMLTDVPSGQMAQFTLHLTNGTQTNQEMPLLYTLIVPEDADTLGLEILMDGVMANGRNVYINPGETIKKIITVRQTDQSVLDYDNVKILFASQYQPFDIQDAVSLSVHFAPSSSPIDLAVDEPVLNIETIDRNKGDLMLKLTNFNRQFRNLKSIGVQYRFEGNTQWNTIHTYVTNRADSLNNSYSILPDSSTIRYTYNMKDDNMFPEGTYVFRAFTTTPYGNNPNDAATLYSYEVKVVKDNVRPRNLTTPTPANGILHYGDDLSIEFNEDIVPGYVSDKNIIVTAKLNDQPIRHDVAKLLRPYGEEQATVNPVFLNGDFSLDLWMKWSGAGTILRLGSGQLRLAVDSVGHFIAAIGDAQVVSEDVVPKDTWTYIVLSYKSADKVSLSALAQYDNTTLALFTDHTVGDIAQLVHYSEDNHLYLGDMEGAMHDLSLFNIYRDVHEAASKKSQTKDNYVYGLTNYWPMKEGHGHVAADTRHTHDFCVNDSWLLDNMNYSLRLDDGKGVEADISRINTGVGDSYAIELWVYPSEISYTQEQTIFEAGSVPSNRLGLYLNQQQDWVLRYGQHEHVVVSHEDIDGMESWNHVALNVVRGQAASFYFNGQRTAVIAELDVPPFEGSRLTLGKGMSDFSNIDEVRIWHAALSESRLLNNMYNCIDTTDVYSRGLVAYYPFEKAGVVNGVTTKVPTLSSIAPASEAGNTPSDITSEGTVTMVEYTPPLKNAPVENRIIAKPVASDRKLVIRLEEGSGIKARDIEGTTLNITVDKIHDMHGNESQPIRWTTFVQLNTLKWTRDSVNIIKSYGDGYTFDVDIENRGGNIEYYTLYNMPQWLTLVDSERTDDIDPLKTKTLRFQVNPLVAVGNYDVTIGLQGNNEILEPLRIVMKVRGEKPAWTVDPNAYENTMSIVGQVYINGILLGNDESLLAAFIGNECRGVVSPKPVRGAAYVVMSVYGTAQQTVNGAASNLDKGQPVTFRIWDATTGMTYTNVAVTSTANGSPVNITFDPSESYGNFDQPIIFTKSNLIEQPLDIRSGWNWLSLSVEPANTKTSVVFKDLVTWNAQLKDKSTGAAYCRGNYWAGNLKEVHTNTMYKLQLTRMENSKELPEPLVVNGEQVKLAETPVTLNKGWNWIAYTPMVTLPIDEALAGANPNIGDQVKSQTGFAYYGPYGWEGNLEALESGKGYLYLSTDKQEVKQFVYPELQQNSKVQKFKNSKSSKIKVQSSPFTPVSPSDYPDNMALVIMLTADGEPIVQEESPIEIAAFIDGECRATALPDVDDGLYYLLVAGEGSGQPMEIRANVGGNVYTICTTLSYSTDGSIGTPWEPFVIDCPAAGIETVQSPTADGQWYTLQGIRLNTRKPNASGVYIYRQAKGRSKTMKIKL